MHGRTIGLVETAVVSRLSVEDPADEVAGHDREHETENREQGGVHT